MLLFNDQMRPEAPRTEDKVPECSCTHPAILSAGLVEAWPESRDCDAVSEPSDASTALFQSVSRAAGDTMRMAVG